MKSSIGKIISRLGIVCIILALSLCVYNVYDTFRAYYAQKRIMEKYSTLKSSSGIVPDYILNLDMDMPEELQTQVLHLILSHHGAVRNGWGSPVDPKTPEAIALHHADDLDAKVKGSIQK